MGKWPTDYAVWRLVLSMKNRYRHTWRNLRIILTFRLLTLLTVDAHPAEIAAPNSTPLWAGTV
jgi:hypothetical protein